jgi:hypothetical protein
MKRFAFLKLEHGGNKVVFDTNAPDLFAAVETFKQHVVNVDLDEYGYGKRGDVSYCVAEYWEPFHTV